MEASYERLASSARNEVQCEQEQASKTYAAAQWLQYLSILH